MITSTLLIDNWWSKRFKEPQTLLVTDEIGNCNFLSIRWKETTGKPIEEGLGSLWLDLVHADDRENIKRSWVKSIAAKKPFEAKFRYINGQGGYDINYANSIPRYNPSGEFAGYIGILQDISVQEQIKASLEKIVLERTDDLRRRNGELKAAEKALREKNIELEKINRELTSFAHVASHDLQEPLRKIQTFADRVLKLEGDKFSERGIDFFGRIQTASSRMRSLIQDLLMYSKTNDVEDQFQATDLNTVFEEVVSEMEIKIEEKNATIENLGLPHLKVVRFQFHQLFLNLLSNALKFSKADTPPHVVIKWQITKGRLIPNSSADKTRDYHHIMISDNGIGFAPEDCNKSIESKE